ncbi:hypothetical protein LEN26_003318 [Aphanomyces euteiches]|nr:hypothetical protein LEN26_003318 [Aphanomyces euteiches]
MAHPHFFRVNCAHSELFRESYIRCFQNNGLKVIRCFPHCCPHTASRGCGASLSLLVDGINAAEPDTLYAFGRFELAAEKALADGERVDWAVFSNHLRGKKNLDGMWLQGRHQVDKTHAVAFHFNKTRTDGWHYEWKSGSSKLKRDMLHRFHVYVVQRESSDDGRIVLSAYSPPFTLASYRRSVGTQIETSSSSRCTRQPRISQLAQTPRSQGLDKAETLFRLFQLASTLFVDEIPPPQWSNIQVTLSIRCVAWSGLNLQPVAMQILPNDRHQDSPNEWTLASESALKVLWSWFDTTTLELFQRLLDRTAGNYRAAYEAGVEAIYETFVVQTFENNMDALEKLLETHQVDDSTADKMCYDAFVCLLRESSMKSTSMRPTTERVPSGCDGVWRLVSTQTGRLDGRPTVLSFFRWLTMLFALELRIRENVLFVQSKLRMFPAPSSMFYLDGQPGTFHTLPNGEACGLDQSAVVGEYKAWMDFGTVQLWIYRWPKESSSDDSSSLLRVVVSPCAFDASVLRISWTLEEATSSSTTAVDLAALPVEDRMNAWDDMEHQVVLQIDTAYSRVADAQVRVSS